MDTGADSLAKDLEEVLTYIVSDSELHSKFINSVSYLENCGARKIAACEHPTLVREEILKHASEEFRHAHYLKKQIKRVTQTEFLDYSLDTIVGGFATLQYLDRLDLFASRYMRKALKLPLRETIDRAYLLVTYAIELRAEMFYPIYHKALKANGSKVTVKSILLEEEEHLAEMRRGISAIPDGFAHAEKVCEYEEVLFRKWFEALTKELSLSIHAG